MAMHLTPIIIGVTMTDKDSFLRRHASISLPLAEEEETTLGAFQSFTASMLLLNLISMNPSRFQRFCATDTP